MDASNLLIDFESNQINLHCFVSLPPGLTESELLPHDMYIFQTGSEKETI